MKCLKLPLLCFLAVLVAVMVLFPLFSAVPVSAEEPTMDMLVAGGEYSVTPVLVAAELSLPDAQVSPAPAANISQEMSVGLFLSTIIGVAIFAILRQLRKSTSGTGSFLKAQVVRYPLKFPLRWPVTS